MKYHISEMNWEQIYKFLQGEKGIHCHKASHLRVFTEAVWYIVRTGCQWRLLPELQHTP